MRRVYVAGAFSGDIDTNCAAAIDCADLLVGLGFAPFVPHLYRAWDARHPRPYEEWMRLCFVEVERCDALYRMPGASPGADREVAHAMAHGVPVYHSIAALLDQPIAHHVQRDPDLSVSLGDGARLVRR